MNVMMSQPLSSLQRPVQEMSAEVESALVEFGLMEAYRDRPPYQQNDYLLWINQAKRPETRDKRIAQMLDELTDGSRYMRMAYRPRRDVVTPGR